MNEYKWHNYYTYKSSIGITLVSIDYIDSSSISKEDHFMLFNGIRLNDDNTHIGTDITNKCKNILKKLINQTKSIKIKILEENNTIYFVSNNILYQYFAKKNNGKLSGRLYKINVHNNENFEFINLYNDIRMKMLTDKSFLKNIITDML
jgi:hypothetical protein